MKFSEITRSIEPALQVFRKEFAHTLNAGIPLLNEVFKHVQTGQGKQIRPVLILLCAEVCGGATAKTYRGAVLTEMLHVSTLLHDDVIDEADVRRGQPSVNALWGNKTAILVGDYLLTETLKLAIVHKDFDLLEIMNEAVNKITEGELLQMQNVANTAISEDIYNEIISKKTASLFAAACASGAISANANKDDVATFYKIGKHLGMAFQIRDDILDLSPEGAEIGKPEGNDIREQKLTLPIIHFLKTTSEINREMAFDVILNHHQNPEKVKHLSRQILNSKSVTYAETIIAEHIEKARVLLNPFPDGNGKTTLQNLMGFIAIRNH